MNPAAGIAIYARYSSDLQNPSSVDDQVALCRQVIKDQFKADQHRVLIYSDPAISGATITKRPGMIALLAAVRAGRVSMVVAEGLDRLSRSMKDIAEIYETLAYHEAAIWTVHEGRITELHVGLKGTMNALFLRDMKEKVRRGQKARVLAGFSSFSCAYGYRVVRGVVDERGRNVNGVREINPQQATVIRRVYEDYAAGKLLLDIVAALNAENIPSPSGGLWKRNALMGSVKKQEGLLRNEIYRGMLVFNRTYVVRDPTTGRKRQIPLPENKWTRVDAPDLRIIDDDLWQKVRGIDRPRPFTAPAVKKPRILTSHNQHALTGWVKCGWCGGSKSLASNTRYVCSTWRYARQCKNSRGTKEPLLLASVFAALEERIKSGPDFRPGLLKAFDSARRKSESALQKEQTIQARIDRLMIAIENGVNTEHATARVLELQHDLAAARACTQAAKPPALPEEKDLRSMLYRTIGALKISNDIVQMRTVFSLLLDRITTTPIPNRHAGETIVIALREKGWPDFWRMITAHDAVR